VIEDMNGQETHVVIRTATIGVQNLLIYNLIENYLEFNCSRATLLPSSWWLYEPRDGQYNIGGWYIEHNKDGIYSQSRRLRRRKAYDVFDEMGETVRQSANSVYTSHEGGKERFLNEIQSISSAENSQIRSEKREQCSLHTAVCILLCAIKTLENTK